VFTGIIETTAEVLGRGDTTLTVRRPLAFDDVREGSSIAVAGVCLTVTQLQQAKMFFDVVPETWTKTTLGERKPGDKVNLERALRADGRFDGHIVQGHVEGTATVTEAANGLLMIVVPSGVRPFVVPKGSITLDGVSLTVANVQDDLVTVALIPTTLRDTTLGLLKPGDRVNVETDILGRYAQSFLSRS
jgi:riboflavin synthase